MNLKPPTDLGQRRLDYAYQTMRRARRAHGAALAAVSGMSTYAERDAEKTLRELLATACDAYETLYEDVIG